MYGFIGPNNAGGAGGGNESPFAACNGTDTCVVDGVEYTKVTLTDYEYCPQQVYDSQTESYISDYCSISTSGTYWTINLGGNKTWEEAKTSCPEGTHLATLGELKSLQSSGQLKCQNGDNSCYFWAMEEYSSSNIEGIGSSGGNGNFYKGFSRSFLQTLCLGN